jgi:hypothetical protein
MPMGKFFFFLIKREREIQVSPQNLAVNTDSCEYVNMAWGGLSRKKSKERTINALLTVRFNLYAVVLVFLCEFRPEEGLLIQEKINFSKNRLTRELG